MGGVYYVVLNPSGELVTSVREPEGGPLSWRTRGGAREFINRLSNSDKADWRIRRVRLTLLTN
jgi:hypothetical protein